MGTDEVSDYTKKADAPYSKQPFNEEMRVKLELQQAILAVTQEVLKERRAEILERAQKLLEVKQQARNARK